MPYRVLVVGPSVPKKLLKRTDCCIIFHPLIVLRPLQIPQAQLVSLQQAQRLILTSTHAASFAAVAHGKARSVQHIYCVGKESARAAHIHFPDASISIPNLEQQEGLRDLILHDRPKSLVWPRSSKARTLLSEALLKERIELIEIPLYEPCPTTVPPSLDNVDEVFFTCPSSVEAFFSLFRAEELSHLAFSAIGPITKRSIACLSINCRPSRMGWMN